MQKVNILSARRVSEQAQEKANEIWRLIQQDPNIQILSEETAKTLENIRSQFDAIPGTLNKISVEKIKKIPKELRKKFRFSPYGAFVAVPLLSGCESPVEKAMKRSNEAMAGHTISTESLQERIDGGSNWAEKAWTSTGEMREVFFSGAGNEILYFIALGVAGKVLGDLKEGNGLLDKTSIDEAIITIIVGYPTSLLLEAVTEWERGGNMVAGGLIGLIAAGLIRVIRQRGSNCP